MSKKIKTNNRHRVCRSVGCKHILSIYNLEVYCHIHRQFANAGYEPAVALAKR
ncbi:MAG: hypothetical protein Q7S07_04085 [Candidatus Omnitrophota bacterium]|nr:hypothetical protein [Candidatus Omnitrophota bacterium]